MCWGGMGREVFYFENEFWAGLPAEAAGPLSLLPEAAIQTAGRIANLKTG